MCNTHVSDFGHRVRPPAEHVFGRPFSLNRILNIIVIRPSDRVWKTRRADLVVPPHTCEPVRATYTSPA